MLSDVIVDIWKPNTKYREKKNVYTAFYTLFLKARTSGFGGLEVACWPLVPKFAGSNPAGAVGFFRAKKSSARLPSEGK